MLQFKLTFYATCLVIVVQSHWSYKGANGGENDWAGICASGRRQSPIDLSSVFAVKIDKYPNLHFLNYGNPPPMDLESLTNNGHTITFTLDTMDTSLYPRVTGGGLPGIYRFSQFHFHWGAQDERGSEHTLNGYHSPMEMHMVHFNEKYGQTFEEAVRNSNGAWDALAVIGVMFQLHQHDNLDIDQLVKELQLVKYLNQMTAVNHTISLNRLLPQDQHRFWRYNGSLTTPPCTEIVIWTIFQERVQISINQLNRFRELMDVDVKSNSLDYDVTESDNFRSTQPLNNRSLWDVTSGSQVNKIPQNRPLHSKFVYVWQLVSGFWLYYQ